MKALMGYDFVAAPGANNTKKHKPHRKKGGVCCFDILWC